VQDFALVVSLRRYFLCRYLLQLAEKQGKYSDQHPEIKKLKNEIDRLEQDPG
jgi:hypothetical protein